MKLSKYIDQLQVIFGAEGDIEVYATDGMDRDFMEPSVFVQRYICGRYLPLGLEGKTWVKVECGDDALAAHTATEGAPS